MGKGWTLAGRLQHLRRAMAASGHGPWSAAEIAARAGLSETYAKYLLTGERDNPSKEAIEGLARCFGIKDLNYFFDDAVTDRVHRQLEDGMALLTALRANNITAVAARLGEMSLDELRSLHAATGEALARGGAESTVDTGRPGTDPAAGAAEG